VVNGTETAHAMPGWTVRGVVNATPLGDYVFGTAKWKKTGHAKLIAQ
jgi:hypothetical protein